MHLLIAALFVYRSNGVIVMKDWVLIILITTTEEAIYLNTHLNIRFLITMYLLPTAILRRHKIYLSQI